MIRISRLTDYGIVLLCYIAREPAGTLTASGLAAQSRLPLPTVAKILKSLCRGGVLRSERGVHGGYALARPADQVSIADVLETLEGPLALTGCGPNCPCGIERTCPVRANWRRIGGVVLKALKELKLSEMTQPLVPGAWSGSDKTPGVRSGSDKTHGGARREARLYRPARRG